MPAEISEAGVATASAGRRSARLPTTAIGVLLVLSALLQAHTLHAVGERALTIAASGFVTLIGVSYDVPILLAAWLASLAWLLAAAVALHRRHPVAASAFAALAALGPAWAVRGGSWPTFFAPAESTPLPPAVVALGVVTAGAAIVASVAAERSGLLGRPAARVILGALAARILGFCVVLALGPPALSVGLTALSFACALLSPLSDAVTGACFVLLGRSDRGRTG